MYVEDVIWALMWTPAACLIHPNVCVCVCVQDGFQGCFKLGLGESYNVDLILLNIFDIQYCHKFGVSTVILSKVFSAHQGLHLFDQKYNKFVKYYYNLKKLFYVNIL